MDEDCHYYCNTFQLNERESDEFNHDYTTRYEEYVEWTYARPLDASQLFDFVSEHAGVELDDCTLDDLVYKIWLSSPSI